MRFLAGIAVVIVGCQSPSTGSSQSDLSLTSPDAESPWCIEPDQVDSWLSPPIETDSSELFLAGPPKDQQVDFYPNAPKGYASSLKVRIALPAKTVAKDLYRDVTVKNRRVRVVAGDLVSDSLKAGADVVLRTGSHTFDAVELIKTYAIKVDEKGTAQVGVSAVDLVAAHGSAPLDSAVFDPDMDLVATPQTCAEHAMVRFGPLPWDMPAVKFPEIKGCGDEDCIKMAHGWLRTHHNVWRANQMMQVLRDMPSVSRSVFWDRPGLSESHQPLDQRTKPSYWWGGYGSEQYDVVQEGISTYWSVIKTARIDVINIKLHCKSNAADPCQTVEPLGYHTVKGHVNVCNKALHDGDNWFDSKQEAVTMTIGHESLHHVWVNGYALSDTASHWHGNSCTGNHQVTKIYDEDSIRHLATYKAGDGGSCNHRVKLRRRVHAYALFAHEIGEMVRAGTMWYWPEPTPPTPQPPECVGDPGCLCSDVPDVGPAIPPDGDYSIDQYCEDNQGEATCQETAVNAGAIVGICTLCDETRGPGCKCDYQMPCDEGECFGDDTYGGGIGHCYVDLPPSWACAADCERLFNDEQAYCYNNHYGGARCMDSDCEKWDADDCYEKGMLCRGGACVAECESQVDCTNLGYPNTYECKSSGRCEPYWY